MAENIIGRVTATENKPTTCDTVRFWVEDNVVIRPFDVVRIPHLSASETYGIIQELSFITDSPGHLASYVSSDFGDVGAEPLNKRLGTTIAEARILCNTKNIEMPVREGATVGWADADAIRVALGIDAIRTPIPAGWIETSNNQIVRVDLDARYVIGPEGAHLNIAGISGLATKTSYAMFLLNSVCQRMADKVTTIIFNVKGSDLLALNMPDPELSDETRKQWKNCDLEPVPFHDVVYFYPFSKRKDNFWTNSHNQPDVLRRQVEDGRAFNYSYDVPACLQGRTLPLLFSDIDDPTGSMDSIFMKLGELDGSHMSWEGFKAHIGTMTAKGGGNKSDITVQSWRKFSRLLQTRTDNDLFGERSQSPEKRQVLFKESLRDHLRPGRTIVIDIEPLPDYLQALVVGEVVQILYACKLGDPDYIDETGRRALGKIVIFADELNKYAPKTDSGGKALTSSLLEITERGRSLGIVLFGAEQFRSGVHDRILGNCSTNIYGRTNPVETAKCPDYRYFPDAYKSIVTRIPQGDLLLQHATFKTPLIRVRFPRPCYYQPKGT
jgi:DNA helicase HerA-like ATPase